MPQLSPLNWMFLFILFWTTISLVSIMIWWSKKTFFSTQKSETPTLKQNKWNW
uniref:ATP synthase F0 subunit 8 n=1 Tax=Bithynia leachii TaxID=2722873 RepID=A0A7D7K1X9_9CAEN|nr:ATP synthase F0 subunit 8 [Bithynia leachii]